MSTSVSLSNGILSIRTADTTADILATTITSVVRSLGDLLNPPYTWVGHSDHCLVVRCTAAEHEAIVTAWKAALDVSLEPGDARPLTPATARQCAQADNAEWQRLIDAAAATRGARREAQLVSPEPAGEVSEAQIARKAQTADPLLRSIEREAAYEAWRSRRA